MAEKLCIKYGGGAGNSDVLIGQYLRFVLSYTATAMPRQYSTVLETKGCTVCLLKGEGNNSTGYVNLEVSNDGSSWTNLRSNLMGAFQYTDDISSYKYVRLSGLRASAGAETCQLILQCDTYILDTH